MPAKQLRIGGLSKEASPTSDAPASDSGGPGGALALQQAGGGGNAAVQQMMARQAQGAASAGTAAAAASPDTYRIEAKAWIPHDKVVDPEEQIRASDWADTITDVGNGIVGAVTFGLAPTLEYEFASFYRGDNHTGFDGSYRVLSALDFTWDGAAINGASHTGSYGTTHRDWNAHAYIDTFLGSKDIAKNSATESGTATSATTGSGSGNRFSLSMASANPLVMIWAPDINANITGTMGADGSIDLSYDTDMFPSHGIRVIKNGATIHTSTVNNAASVNALGPTGAANLGARLMLQENEGNIQLPSGGTTGSRTLNNTSGSGSAGGGAGIGGSAGIGGGSSNGVR